MNCKDCEKEIVWMRSVPTDKNPKPRPAPIEMEPYPNGNLVVSWERKLYRFATPEEREIAKRENKNLYVNHFAHCPNAIARRKIKRKSLEDDRNS